MTVRSAELRTHDSGSSDAKPRVIRPNVLITSVRPDKTKAVWAAVAKLEAAGFTRIGVAGIGGVLGFATSILHESSSISVVTSVQPTIFMHPHEAGRIAMHLNGVFGDRFTLGVGISHAPHLKTDSLATLAPLLKQPLRHIRDYVGGVRDAGYEGGLQLAAVGPRMVALATEVADGLIFAHIPRSDLESRLHESVASARNPNFLVGGVIVTAVDEDIAVARERARSRIVTTYASLPNYRNSWRVGGYATAMDQLEAALERQDDDGVRASLSDEFIDDVCIVATPASLPSSVAAYRAAGVHDPILHLTQGTVDGGTDFDLTLAAYAESTELAR